jgi:DNA repair protein RadD
MPDLDVVATILPPLIPRRDQQEAHDAVISALDAGIRRPLVVAPMAWGKSVLLAMLVVTLATVRGLRVLVLAHRRELLEQNSGVLRRLAPDLDAGICSASLKSDRLDAQVVIGGTATIYRRLSRIGHVDVVLLDESHLMGPGSSTMLARILASLGNPPLVGCTATPYRTDSALLVEAGIFEAVVHDTTLRDALDAGLLAPLVVKAPKQGRIDLSNVRIVAGEFHAGQMEAAAMAGDITRQAVARTVEVARTEGRRSWLLFASGVAHARQIGSELGRHGISHEVIVGDTVTDERSNAIARFRAGELTALVNCNVLTTGFDATGIDLIGFMRATCSPVLWVQSMGRGMRVHPGKSECRALDFGNNVFRHGPIDNIRLRATGERHDANAAASRTRICRFCEEVNPRDALVCIGCGEQLVRPIVPKIGPVAADLEVIGGDAARPEWTAVLSMHATVHEKVGAPASFRISFHTPSGWVSDFLPLAHPSPGARWHAQRKWRRLSRRQHAEVPLSAAEAAQRFQYGELRRPARLLVERDGQWLRVKDVAFEKVEAAA